MVVRGGSGAQVAAGEQIEHEVEAGLTLKGVVHANDLGPEQGPGA